MNYWKLLKEQLVYKMIYRENDLKRKMAKENMSYTLIYVGANDKK